MTQYFFKLQSAFWWFQTMTVSECCMIKLFPYILFQKIYMVSPGTVPVVSAHTLSLPTIHLLNMHSVQHTGKKVKVKVAHTRLPSVGFRSWSRFLAVSLQVTWIINPAVGCHYFPPGLQLPSQPLSGLLPFCCLVNRGTMGVNSLPKTVTRQRRYCDLNPGPSAPESSTLTTLVQRYNDCLIWQLTNRWTWVYAILCYVALR